MTIEVKRSPASVSWWVSVNGNFLSAHDRKWQAEAERECIMRQYGLK